MPWRGLDSSGVGAVADDGPARLRGHLRWASIRPTGVDSLTASELRIARLAAAGRTNAQIAQELWLSPKTVETHLSHAYGKLDLAGQGARAGLAQVLQGDAAEAAAPPARSSDDREVASATP